MNITAFWNAGAKYGRDYQRKQADRTLHKAAEQQRKRWINALYADTTRAWMDLGQDGKSVLNGLVLALTLAGMAKVYDAGSESNPDVRVIRGAISAAEQCAKEGCVLKADHAKAMTAAAYRAIEIVRACSWEDIVHACDYLDKQLSK